MITQNVDGLHQAGGARDVVELHGGLDRTVCLGCGDVAGRAELDERLQAANPTSGPRVDEVNPDGDAELPDEVLDGFVMVGCLACGDGPLKPDVVFFGETVPRDRVERCFGLVDGAGSLLVLGSSLTVMSGYRFVLRAAKLGIPVAIVNVGPDPRRREGRRPGRRPAGRGAARRWPRRLAAMTREVERTDDGRYVVVDGRRWRTADPALPGRRPRAAAAPPRRRPVRRAHAPGGRATTRPWRPPGRGCSWPRPGWGSAGPAWWDQDDDARRARWEAALRELDG